MSSVCTITQSKSFNSTTPPKGANNSYGYTKDQLGNYLFDILEVYPASEWHDELSMRLRNWSIKVLKLGLEIDDETTFQKVAAAKLQSLSKILCNFIGRDKPMTAPVIDRDLWVWDEAYLECFQKYSQHSPFDAKAFNVRPHDFARSIIEWSSFLPGYQNEASAKEKAAGPLFSKERLPEIHVWAQTEIFIRGERNRARVLRNKVAAEKLLNEQITKKCAEKVAETQEQHESATAATTQRIEELEKTQKSNMNLLKGQVQTLSASVESSQAALQNAQLYAAFQENEIKILRNQYTYLQGQVNELQNKKKGGCAIM